MPERLIALSVAEWWWIALLPFTLLLLAGIWIVMISRQQRAVRVNLRGLGVSMSLELGSTATFPKEN